MKKKSVPISVRAGSIEFLKLNTARREWRDSYHWILSLRWPAFAAFLLGVYFTVNLLFAALYSLGGNCIEGMPAGSFREAFFFSVETLATVGYGHMYPATLYGHLLTTIELIIGMFGLAVITGLIFVRFSRPTARIVFSKSVVIAPFDGKPTLMMRVANLRHTSVVEAEFRMTLSRDERTREGDEVRRFYELKVHPNRMIIFPAALTIRHRIDEQSPLHGMTREGWEATDSRLIASVVCVETVLQASVQSQKDYSWRDVRFGERFVEIYTEMGGGRLTVDYGRLHDTEPVPISSSLPPASSRARSSG